MSRADDFEEPSFTLEGTDEGMDNGNLDEIETPHPKLSISKKAAKKRDARRRIEDYLELKRVKEVIEDFDNGNKDMIDSWCCYEEGTGSDIHTNKNK